MAGRRTHRRERHGLGLPRPEARTWLGDALASQAEKTGTRASAWTEAHAAYAQSLTDWKKLAGAVPSEAAIRIADLEKKIACDGALHAAGD